jgi:acetolactate synthase regulatory subunit
LTPFSENRSICPNNANKQPKRLLVVVLVAQRRGRGVKDIPNTHVRSDTVHVDVRVQAERPARYVVSVDAAQTSRVLVLPDAEVAVDEAVMQPENGVGGRAVGVLHDGSNTVVAPGVRTTFRAGSHAGEVAVGVALVHVVGVAVLRLCAVAVAGEAVNLVAGSGTDVDGEVGKLLRLG